MTGREKLVDLISLVLKQMLVDDSPDEKGFTKSMVLAERLESAFPCIYREEIEFKYTKYGIGGDDEKRGAK